MKTGLADFGRLATQARKDVAIVAAGDASSITWHFMASDLSSTPGAAAFEGLEARLSAIDGIERLAWEDRERFLARLRPGADVNTLREAVAAAMRSASATR